MRASDPKELPESLQADLEALNSKRIDFREFNRRQYIRQKHCMLPRLMEARERGQWEEFIDIALTAYEVLPEAFKHYEEVPNSLKYNFAIEAYMYHGDSVPAVRKAVRGAMKYGRPDLPAEIAAQEAITIYRAGEETPEKAPYRISWTTERAVAEFFLNEYRGRHATHIYKGLIKPKHIIAYTDDRSEKEIMQYGKVYQLQEL